MALKDMQNCENFGLLKLKFWKTFVHEQLMNVRTVWKRSFFFLENRWPYIEIGKQSNKKQTNIVQTLFRNKYETENPGLLEE